MEARLRRVLLLIEDGADAEEVGRVDWGRWVGESGRSRLGCEEAEEEVLQGFCEGLSLSRYHFAF